MKPVARSTERTVSRLLRSRTGSIAKPGTMLPALMKPWRLNAEIGLLAAKQPLLLGVGVVAGSEATGAAQTSATTVSAAWPGRMANGPDAANMRVSEGDWAQKHWRAAAPPALQLPSVGSRLPDRLRHSRGT